MKIVDSLSTFNAYPLPLAKREIICIQCGLISEDELTNEISMTRNYQRAKAMVFDYLASAPSVNENGISYSFSEADKKRFARISRSILESIGERNGQEYGYKGEDF